MNNQLVEFLETALVQQKFDPLARRHFARFVLPVDSLRPASGLCGLVAAIEFRRQVVEGHRFMVI